jgi:hypothetical protein
MDRGISKAWRPPHPHLAVGFQAFYDHLRLSLVLKEVAEELFFIRVILADPLRADLHEAKAVESLPRREP